MTALERFERRSLPDGAPGFMKSQPCNPDNRAVISPPMEYRADDVGSLRRLIRGKSTAPEGPAPGLPTFHPTPA